MLLTLNADQEYFRKSTTELLDDRSPADEVRRLRDDPAGFDTAFWRAGAELGWTSLLVSAEHGRRDAMSRRGPVDLSLVAYEFGRRAAPGPLVDTNVVAAALSVVAPEAHAQVLGGLLSGESNAAWCMAERSPDDRFGEITTSITPDGDALLINGVKRPVECAGQAGHLLVTGRTGYGLTQVLVPRDVPGLSMRPLRSVDPTRRFYEVVFSDVRMPCSALVGTAGAAGEQVARQWNLAAILLVAGSVGAMRTAFHLTVEWALNRCSSGGAPAASYHALRHRFADMKSWLEASHAIAGAAVAAVADGSADAAELVSAAKAFVGDHGVELLQECLELHSGACGTYEHDLHLYLRRVTLDRALCGSPADHRQRIATIAETREEIAETREEDVRPRGDARGGSLVGIARAACRLDDLRTRDLIGEARTLDLVARELEHRLRDGVASGRMPEHSAAIGRLFTGTVQARKSTIAFDLAGTAGAVWSEDDEATADVGRRFRKPAPASAGGGTIETARNVVSEGLLGMPHDRALDRNVPFQDVPGGPDGT